MNPKDTSFETVLGQFCFKEEKCQDVTQGYATKRECSKWPKTVCTVKKSNVKKYSPETGCIKKPRQVCGPGENSTPRPPRAAGPSVTR